MRPPVSLDPQLPPRVYQCLHPASTLRGGVPETTSALSSFQVGPAATTPQGAAAGAAGAVRMLTLLGASPASLSTLKDPSLSAGGQAAMATRDAAADDAPAWWRLSVTTEAAGGIARGRNSSTGHAESDAAPQDALLTTASHNHRQACRGDAGGSETCDDAARVAGRCAKAGDCFQQPASRVQER